MEDRPELVGIGNAMVDVITLVTEDQLRSMEIEKGAMTLINAHVAEQMQASVAPELQCSGGSVANTLVYHAWLGGSAKLIGRVADDELGRLFADDLAQVPVAFDTPPLGADPSTGRCYVFVTPDAQRTLCAYLGASTQLSKRDMDVDAIRNAKVTLVEGYLWDARDSLELIFEATECARRNDTLVALALSDGALVDRHRRPLQRFIEGHVDLVFANEEEARHLYPGSTMMESIKTLADKVDTLVVTHGANGSTLMRQGETSHVDAVEVPHVVDSTGAGDSFAGSFLNFWLTQGLSQVESMREASKIAAETVAHIGGRPDRNVRFPVDGGS